MVDITLDKIKDLMKQLEDMSKELEEKQTTIVRMREEELALRQNAYLYYPGKLYTTTDIANELKLEKGAKELNKILHEMGIQNRNGTKEWYLRDDLLKYCLVAYQPVLINNGKDLKYNRKWTEAGKNFVISLIKGNI